MNRNKFEIIANILDAIGNGSTRTKIMYKSFLPYVMLMEYLHLLEKNDLVARQKSERIYKVTEKGRRYLEHYNASDCMVMVSVRKKNAS